MLQLLRDDCSLSVAVCLGTLVVLRSSFGLFSRYRQGAQVCVCRLHACTVSRHCTYRHDYKDSCARAMSRPTPISYHPMLEPHACQTYGVASDLPALNLLTIRLMRRLRRRMSPVQSSALHAALDSGILIAQARGMVAVASRLCSGGFARSLKAASWHWARPGLISSAEGDGRRVATELRRPSPCDYTWRCICKLSCNCMQP